MTSKLQPLSRKNDATFAQGRRHVIGVDEAGRGPLAGPVVAASVWFSDEFDDALHEDLKIYDSKVMDEDAREKMYDLLTKNAKVHWAVSITDHEEIDRVNILQATMLSMKRATCSLLASIDKLMINSKSKKGFSRSESIVLVDGNRVPEDMPVDTTFVIKGDSKVYSIAAASIIAKVTRDRIMYQLHELYPVYNFAKHKGYPTFEHRTALVQHGACPVHRRSYGPVKIVLAEKDDAVSVKGQNEKRGKGVSTESKSKSKSKSKPHVDKVSATGVKRKAPAQTQKLNAATSMPSQKAHRGNVKEGQAKKTYRGNIEVNDDEESSRSLRRSKRLRTTAVSS
jgi:ribonuclease HII